jgi:cytochrome c-type biogenesis protein CcmH
LIAIPLILAFVVAVAAIVFASAGLWIVRPKGMVFQSVAISLFLLVVGGGTYMLVGRPSLALREFAGNDEFDPHALIKTLISKSRHAPKDAENWALLAHAYMATNDPSDAVRAYRRAFSAGQNRTPLPKLASAFGQALVAESGGVVSREAEEVFEQVLDQDPSDPAARFFVGEALAAQGDKDSALAYWRSLLADTPSNHPLHKILADRIEILVGSDSSSPDPKQMVAQLAAKLHSTPQDAPGWQRLIKSYSVLGEIQEAQEALSTARRVFAGDPKVLAALQAEARNLKLN